MQTQETISTDKIPPQAVDVEKSVLAAMMVDNEAIGRAVEIIDESCFYREDHQLIYLAILSLFQQNHPVDLLTVTEELKKRKQLQAVGEEIYLTELLESATSSANVEYHARILLEKSTLRKLITASQEIQSLCFEGMEAPDDVLDKAETKIFNISEGRIKQGFIRLDRLLPRTFEDIEKYSSGTVAGISSGFAELDALTTGFQPSNLVIVAARPSMGKTSFALSLMLNAAIRHGIGTALFSLEMSKEEIAQRLLCAEARVNMHTLRSGHLPKRDYPKLSLAAGPLAEAPIYIDDSPGLNVLELRAKSRRLKRQNNIGLVLVDYMQLMHSSTMRVENRQQEIAQISRSLKALAKEMEIPVIALSQLSRQVEQRGKGAKPQLSDLRESGAIEQDADVVIFIHRSLSADDPAIEEGSAEIIVGKQRNGPTGIARLAFVREYARFENLSAREGDAGGFTA